MFKFFVNIGKYVKTILALLELLEEAIKLIKELKNSRAEASSFELKEIEAKEQKIKDKVLEVKMAFNKELGIKNLA